MKDSGIEWVGKIPSNWGLYRFKNIGLTRNGLTYNPQNLVGENNGVLVLRSSNVQNGKLSFTDNVYVDMEIKDDLMLKVGDILICSRNGSRDLIGKNAIIESKINASFGAFMMIFRTKNPLPKYVKYILDSSIFKYYLGTYLTATINQLTTSNFDNMRIVYTPSVEEQKIIVDYLDYKINKIDKLLLIKQEKISQLQQYKKSLIYEYVTGKRTVEL
jgi:type I restriction enzyme S subunit